MGKLVEGDDGLPAEANVGIWTEDKHRTLRAYLQFHAGPRVGYASRTYIDLFCGPGRAQLKDSERFIDGSAIVAWKSSLEKAPFTAVYIADSDAVRRRACAERLGKLGAPVVEVAGDAVQAAQRIVATIDPHGLHFAFVDPYSLGSLQLELLRILAGVKRMDQLVHLSAMDLFRNLNFNLAGVRAEFDAFAPGWQEHIPKNGSKDECRRAIVEHWKTLVDAMGLNTTIDLKAVKNSMNRDLYWLMVLSHHALATKFWKIVLQSEPQRQLL